MANPLVLLATLDVPVERAVRLVALILLAGACDSARWLESDPASPEALHAFRIATRRLRSWIKSWRPLLRHHVRRKDGRRLRRIAVGTGAARDLDAHLKWIDAGGRGRQAKPPAALAAFRSDCVARREGARTAVAAAAAELLARKDALQRRIAVYHEDVRDVAGARVSFGDALATTAREAAEALRERLAMVDSQDDAAAIHAVRIAAKRLRYLLEPVPDIGKLSSPLIKALTSLQDDAGSLHDAHVLMEALSRGGSRAAGVSKLVHRVNSQAGKSYAALEKHWLGSASTPFFARVQRLAAALASSRVAVRP